MNEKQKRKLERIKGYSGLSRVLVLDPITGLYKEPNSAKNYRAITYIKENGKPKRISRYFSSFAEAKAFRQNHSKLNESKPVQPIEVGMTFGELASEWCERWLPTKELSTQIRYKSYLQHFKNLWLIPVRQIVVTTIDEWITELRSKDYLERSNPTRCSYKHEFSVLRIILNYFIQRHDRNYRLPFIKEHQVMLKVKDRLSVKKDLSILEYQRFLLALRDVCVGTKWEAIFYLAQMQYAIYGRIQDAAALFYEDFDLERNVVIVRRKAQWLRARGYEDRIVDGSKTNGGKEIPLTQYAIKVFREWVLKSGARSGLLFQVDGQLITYRQLEHRYTQSLKNVGLPYRATHLLRHASLTEAYNACGDLLVTQALAGHSDLRATTRYAKVRNEKILRTQQQMDERLSSIVVSD